MCRKAVSYHSRKVYLYCIYVCFEVTNRYFTLNKTFYLVFAMFCDENDYFQYRLLFLFIAVVRSHTNKRQLNENIIWKKNRFYILNILQFTFYSTYYKELALSYFEPVSKMMVQVFFYLQYHWSISKYSVW